jgi:hypothetical protein
VLESACGMLVGCLGDAWGYLGLGRCLRDAWEMLEIKFLLGGCLGDAFGMLGDAWGILGGCLGDAWEDDWEMLGGKVFAWGIHGRCLG